jgi:hypothetical protein
MPVMIPREMTAPMRVVMVRFFQNLMIAMA